MNPALLLKLTVGSGMRQYVTVMVAAMTVIVALPFLAVGSMGSSALSFLSAAPSAEHAETEGFYMGGPVPGDTYAWGNCTYWVFAKRLWAGSPIPTNWGNANTWDDNARRDGYVVNHTPAVGAIFQTDAGVWGHVAYVTDVFADGSWKITEMNAPNLNVVSSRTFSPFAAVHYTFIHQP